jgi:NAD-dependent deacetylase
MVGSSFSDRTISLLQGREPVVALTGAGISADSGLATFRGPDGLWNGHDPQTLATPEAFARDPLLVWRFYAWRRERAAAAEPNAAHRALAALEHERGEVEIVTQNVDGLHERAGSASVLRLHGTLWRLRCVGCAQEVDDTRADLGPLPPRCACGALLRPAVVWFGEPLDRSVLARADDHVSRAALVLVVGTSSVVQPAASLATIARRRGARVVEINLERTALSDACDEHVEGRAKDLVPLLVAEYDDRADGEERRWNPKPSP